MRVLVVDDDKLVAVSLKTILEADGEITVVGLGEAGDDAIRLYREQHPDILLMDIRMQGMSGLDAAECILKEDQAAKILFLTTFSDDEYIVKALNMGAKGYLLFFKWSDDRKYACAYREFLPAAQPHQSCSSHL